VVDGHVWVFAKKQGVLARTTIGQRGVPLGARGVGRCCWSATDNLPTRTRLGAPEEIDRAVVVVDGHFRVFAKEQDVLARSAIGECCLPRGARGVVAGRPYQLSRSLWEIADCPCPDPGLPLSSGAGLAHSLDAGHPHSPGFGLVHPPGCGLPLSSGSGLAHSLDADHPRSPGFGHPHSPGSGLPLPSRA